MPSAVELISVHITTAVNPKDRADGEIEFPARHQERHAQRDQAKLNGKGQRRSRCC